MARERAAPNVEVELKRENMEAVGSFEYLGNCFSKVGGHQRN